jgi:hypothetical protein
MDKRWKRNLFTSLWFIFTCRPSKWLKITLICTCVQNYIQNNLANGFRNIYYLCFVIVSHSWSIGGYSGFAHKSISLCQIGTLSMMSDQLIRVLYTEHVQEYTTDPFCRINIIQDRSRLAYLMYTSTYSNLLEPHVYVGADTNWGLPWTHASGLLSH